MGGDRRRVPMRRALLLALAIMIPAIPIAVGLAIGLQKPGAGAAATTVAGFTPVGPSTVAATATTPATPKLPAIPGGSGALIARVVHTTALRASPIAGARSIARLPTKTEFGSPEMLWVV